MLCSLLLIASHPLLDWTNSYGVRPFLPWDGRWIYGDILFVVDPWVWLVLGGACFLMTARTRLRTAAWALVALSATAVFYVFMGRGAAQGAYTAYTLWAACVACFVVLHWLGAGARLGRKIAAPALAFVVIYCCALAVMHARAQGYAEQIALDFPQEPQKMLTRVAATPLPADPRAWRCLAETSSATFRFDVTLDAHDVGPHNLVAFEKPAGDDARIIERASEDGRARVLLDFARFPVARVRRDEAGGWVVQLADLRFTEPGSRARPGSFALDVTVK
jgi:inner membrane protein